MNSFIIALILLVLIFSASIFLWKYIRLENMPFLEKIFSLSGYLALVGVGLCAGYLTWWNYQDAPAQGEDEIVFVLDVSKSMNVADIGTSTRLFTAKQVIQNWVKNSAGARYGLVIFSGEATSVLPLTSDKNTFLTFLSGVDHNNLVKQSTDFAPALDLAYKRFSGEGKNRQIVVLTDGGEDGDVKEGSLSYQNNIKYHIFGVGSLEGGNIPIGTDLFGTPLYKTQNGAYVVSKLHQKNISQLAKYFHTIPIYIENENDIENKGGEKILHSQLRSSGEEKIKYIFIGGIGFLLYVWFLCVHFWKKSLIYYIRKIGKRFL